MSDHAYTTGSPTRVKVWDIGVRLFHWSLVGGVLAAYLTEDLRRIHRPLGYTVAALIAFRLIWGLIGSSHARFSDFVPGPRRLLSYLRDMVRGREARHLGHNPAGGVMIVALLVTLGAVCTTGYMMGMDAYFGQDWVEKAHGSFVNLLLVLIAGHLAGVVFSSLRHRENLVLSMITGEKRAED